MSMSINALKNYQFARPSETQNIQTPIYAKLSKETAAKLQQSSFSAVLNSPASNKPASKDSVTLSAQAQQTLDPAPKTLIKLHSVDGETWKKARVEDGTFEKYKDAGDKVELPSLTTAYVAKGYEDQYKIGKVDPAEVKEGFGNYFVYRMEHSITLVMNSLQGWQYNTQRVEDLENEETTVSNSLIDSYANHADAHWGRLEEAVSDLQSWAEKNGVEEEASQFFAEYTEKYFGQKLNLQDLQNITAQAA